MINQWGHYAGLGSSETALVQPTDAAPPPRLTILITCIVAIAAVLATTVVLYGIS